MSRLFFAGLCAMLLAIGGMAAPSGVRAQDNAARARPSAKSLDYASRYAKAVNMDKAMLDLMEMIMPLAIEAEAGKRPGLTSKEKAALQSAALESSRVMSARFVELLTEKMAGVYTEEELRSLVEFYESPVGRSIAAKEDALAKASEAAAAELVPEFANDMVDRLCRKIDCEASTARPTST